MSYTLVSDAGDAIQRRREFKTRSGLVGHWEREGLYTVRSIHNVLLAFNFQGNWQRVTDSGYALWAHYVLITRAVTLPWQQLSRTSVLHTKYTEALEQCPNEANYLALAAAAKPLARRKPLKLIDEGIESYF